MASKALYGARGDRPRAVLRHLVNVGIGKPVSTVALVEALGFSREMIHSAMKLCAGHGWVLMHKLSFKRLAWAVTEAGAQKLAEQAVAPQTSRKTTKAERAALAEKRREEADAVALRERMSAWQPLPRSTAAHALEALARVRPGELLESAHIAAAIGVDDPRDIDTALGPAVLAGRVRAYPASRDVRRTVYGLVQQPHPQHAAGVTP